ncbi:PucR family transcriptional regulator ligand-binding domain-containing protein [Salicibibacter cibarius]|uniref:PucR family transcriptional regulator ligand-binding domain-containing protein n=1 Tax=Salicibibacter cibarius TaxID=2743000 RepID=A0A7T6Z1P1_9BACI|nr:PucR family transcriptional regulator [Salicibibacter cibarius]QQK74651.1 PucR family transcriptional regulator ligand-binding domain-containing protein [Salicibibacter cibarius]
MLTVKDILQRPMFQSAHVVSKKADLERNVRWVHVLEVTEFETLLRGGEMILSTGVALKDQGVDYVQKLIANDVACLCIELGESFPTVPKGMIELADTYHFPLIVFTSIVRFVDITQDIHADIINFQHQQLSALDRLSNEFHQLTLRANGNLKILKKLQLVTRREIIFLPTDDYPLFIPGLNQQEQRRIQSEVEQAHKVRTWFDKKRQKSFLLKPIDAMGQNWGFILINNDKPMESFDYHALDRATGALAQNLLRVFYTEEKRLINENSWIHDLIAQNVDSEREARAKLNIYPNKELMYRMSVIKMKRPYEMTTDKQTLQYQTIRRIRYLFQQHGVDSFITISQNNAFIVLSVDKQFDNHEKKRMTKVVSSIEENSLELPLCIFVSQIYTKLLNAYLAFQETEDVMRMVNIQDDSTIHFYEDMGIYQLLFKLDDHSLENFIHTYLHPILKYDERKNSNLLYTLKIYLKLNCSKQQSAQRLQIARQTLYQRLDKIEELFGQDVTANHQLRLAVEVAIVANDLNT